MANWFFFILDSRIHTRVFTVFKVNFPKLDATEEHYNSTLSNCLEEMEGSAGSAETVKSPHRLVYKNTPTPALPSTAASMSEIDVAETISSFDISTITSHESSKLSDLADLAFVELGTRNGIDTNSSDFAPLAVERMKRLQEQKKGNLIYKFAMCIGKKQPGTQQLLFLLDQMPFGLVEYQIEFATHHGGKSVMIHGKVKGVMLLITLFWA